MTARAAASAPGASGWRLPLGRLRTHLANWLNARQPLTDTLVLAERNIYVLPTRAGVMLAATLLVLLVASINYQLNLGYLLTFLLAGSAVVGLYVGHATLRGLTLHLGPPQAHFAGTAGVLEVQLASTRRTPRYAVGLRVRGSRNWAWADVPAQGSATVQLGLPPMPRGLHPAPTLIVETRFPLGTFRAWSVWRPAAQVMVYPAPEQRPPPLPPGQPRAGETGIASPQSSGEFDGVRAWRRGDPLRLVVWKKLARADELVSRDTRQARHHDLWLDYAQAGALDTEARLSRLCAWVQAAERLGLDYGLRLPRLELPPACGARHQRQCLEALAQC